MFISMYVEKIALWKICRSNHYFSVEVQLHLRVFFEGVDFHKCFGQLFHIFDTYERIKDLLVLYLFEIIEISYWN